MADHQINLALQGGGAHGAYTWGVLDRLLEEKDIAIHSISGTSAGAMNATIMADGFRRGGREKAKEKLHEFWFKVSQLGSFLSPLHQTPLDHLAEGWNIDQSFGYQMFDNLTRMFSPYQLNPLALHPLRKILAEMIDWDTVNKGGSMSLFLTATAVRTGHARIFRCHEINEDVLLASACIPNYFQAIEIDGEPYWDGGYTGNPSIWPLIYNTPIKDVLLVQINPLVRQETPKSAHEIVNRLNEITFNSSLIAEMRAINFVSKLVKDNHLPADRYRDVNMHMIPAPDPKYGLNASSKVNTDWKFLEFLRDIGREEMENWLRQHKHSIGKKSSLDIEKTFLDQSSASATAERREDDEQTTPCQRPSDQW